MTNNSRQINDNDYASDEGTIEIGIHHGFDASGGAVSLEFVKYSIVIGNSSLYRISTAGL